MQLPEFLDGLRWKRVLFWIAAVVSVGAVGISTGWNEYVSRMTVPPYVYLFGFLGAMVYVFTSLADEFGDDAYVYKVLSKALAALPLAAGVYLLIFALPAAPGAGANVSNADAPTLAEAPSPERLAAGLAFIAGTFVSMTLKALGSLAERLLGVERGGREENDTPEGDQDGDGTPERSQEGEGG